MNRIAKIIGVVAVTLLAIGVVLAAPPAGQEAFTPDKPENQGLSGPALARLVDEMDRLVAEKRLVGAEMVILKNRRIVLQAVAGWKDRESGVQMDRDTIFSLRSMAKPLIGLAAQVLIDEGRLSPQDKVSRFLPAFGQGPGAVITVEHLLTQRSGLPKSGADFVHAAGLQAMVEGAAAAKPAFAPGTDFLASDAGADVLAAVIEKASGLALEDLIRKRLLEPLGMKNTFAFTNPDDPRAGRIASTYVGTTGNWNRNWSLANGPLYGFAMGSQSFYSTPLDYGRLLSLLLDGGRVEGRKVLSPVAVKRVLTPVSNVPSDTGFSGVKLHYGEMMQLLVPSAGSKTEPAAFGHSSPEGMLAWAWPESDLIILFFTQTRGVRAEVPVETVMDQVLIHPGEVSEVPAAYRPLLGKFVDVYGPSGIEEISIVFLNGRLAVDIPNQAVFILEPPDAQGRYALTRNSSIALSFVRNDHGDVIALRRHQGDKSLDIPRLGTPEAEALLDKVRKTQEGWKKYVGLYKTEQPGQNVEIVMREGSLGILRQGQTAPLLLRQPNAQGRWRLKANPAAYVTFEENDKGEVVSFTFHAVNGQSLVRPRIGESAKS